MLEVKNLNTGYGKKQVLFDISLNVGAGEIVALIGPNGSGKSTILKAISGILPVWKGEVHFNGEDITYNKMTDNVEIGLTYSPQGNRIFDELSVKENLEIGGYLLSKGKLQDRINSVLELFPALKKRLHFTGGNLSGGEQQMLALSRALVPEPKLLLLDEPSLGLAPNLVNSVFNKISNINKNFNFTILIVEQKVKGVLNICDYVYSLKLGKIAFEGKPSKLIENKDKLKELFL